MTNAIINQLAAAYTKAVLHNPKDVVYANIERAVNDCPIIAAAPDLLEALKEAQRLIGIYGFRELSMHPTSEGGKCLEQVSAAIAKAEGK